MTGGVWAALGGYAIGSAQVLALDWVRSRAQVQGYRPPLPVIPTSEPY
jgi:hypothetical protein